jgi:hypothetical protein
MRREKRASYVPVHKGKILTMQVHYAIARYDVCASSIIFLVFSQFKWIKVDLRKRHKQSWLPWVIEGYFISKTRVMYIYRYIYIQIGVK